MIYLRVIIYMFALPVGANSGIGLSTAKLLYQQGANVVMTCRDMNKCHQAVQDIRAAKLAYPYYNVRRRCECFMSASRCVV